MSKPSPPSVIRLRGVRHNNLKNFDLDLPLNRLIVLTGLSGSGKSSLAFDTLFAEGQRRYIETFSPYARQFFDRMDKPQVDRIEGIPPAIAIEQRNAVKTTRSTVGTMTEICDYMKLLWPQVARLYCRQCGRPVQKDSPQQIWQAIWRRFGRAQSPSPLALREAVPRPAAGGAAQTPPDELEITAPVNEVLVAFDLPLAEKLSLDESLALIGKQGYRRLLVDHEVCPLEDVAKRWQKRRPQSLTVVQDRIRLSETNRPRFVEACEQAYHFGKGKLAIYPLAAAAALGHRVRLAPERFSSRFHCAQCDIEYREPTPALFSFNHPVGACPTCRGFGRTITIDYDLAIPDRSRTLAQGAVKPWQTGQGAECQEDLIRLCGEWEIPTDVPFEKLAKKWQDWVIHGDPDYGKDDEHRWPQTWYGVQGYFRWLETKAYKMHVRVLLSRYRAYRTCPACQGKRLQPEALLFRVNADAAGETGPPSPADRFASLREGHPEPALPAPNQTGLGRSDPSSLRAPPSAAELTLAGFYQLPLREALKFIERLAGQPRPGASDPVASALSEVRARLSYLVDVGLGYLALDRPTRSLSGGETERVNLTTCLGTRLVNTLFVLDEPSVGLHPRDSARLVQLLESLRDAGNTVLVVEHEACVIRAADQVVDLGPGHGESGGRVVFQGAYAEILNTNESLTGQYLSGRKQIEIPTRRPVNFNRDIPRLVLTHATLHNLADLTVQIPLGRFVGVTGVSGSGKTTLVRDVLLPELAMRLKARTEDSKTSEIDNDHQDPDEGADPERGQQNQSGFPVSQSAMLEGWEHLGRVVLVDQSALGKTPRSNPAVYIGAFEDIRELYANSEGARQRGLNASAFSFNSAQGQCERCRGAGFEKIEMQFLSDVFIRCPDCNGRRYRPHILAVTLSPGPRAPHPKSRPGRPALRSPRSTSAWNIADVLAATVDDAIEFLSQFAEARPAQRAIQRLSLLQEVGLGYLRLGQPINTLSGGECQRLKLVSHLAEFAQASVRDTRPTLFLFDEPTTGLHFDDIRILLQVFQRLVDAGHSLIVIEHNLDVIRCADWLIDLGPDAGDRGGQVVAQGAPEQVAACRDSHTGQALAVTMQLNRRSAFGEKAGNKK